MWFSYPISAVIAQNWVHDTIVEILKKIDDDIRVGLTSLDWPGCIPVGRRVTLQSRSGLKYRLEAFFDKYKSISDAEKTIFLEELSRQNDIAGLLSNTSNCRVYTKANYSKDSKTKVITLNNVAQLSVVQNQISYEIKAELQDLFEFLFELLTALNSRDDFYSILYNAYLHKVCQMCGDENLDSPMLNGVGDREDFDHYLPKSKHPLSAANLYNLVPIGSKCNSLKSDHSIIYKNEIRRKALNPYSSNLGQNFEIDLSGSHASDYSVQEFEINWVIAFTPLTEEVETWCEIFQIDRRYKENILKPYHMQWLYEFRCWCNDVGNIKTPSKVDILNLLDRYRQLRKNFGFYDRNFMRIAFFDLIYTLCDQNHKRVLDLVESSVIGI